MAKMKTKGLSGAVMKAMGIFSGVQIVTILSSLIRNKLIALWLGAKGVGIIGLFNSALEPIAVVAQMGLRTSTVPDIAGANGKNALARISYIVRAWSWTLGVLGAFVTLALSPWLSKLTFGSYDYMWSFMLLSATIFFGSLGFCEMAIMQGTNMLSQLAKATLWGNVTGLIADIPLLYFLRERSIVPIIFVNSFLTALFAWLLRRRTGAPQPRPSVRETFAAGTGFFKLGLLLTVSGFVTLLSAYIFMAWLNLRGGTDEVGLYNAGYTLTNRYIGLVFTAIAMEYFPRLCRVRSSRNRLSLFASHEALIAVLIILPVSTIFLSVDDFIIRLLYDRTFEPVAPYIQWSLAGTVFRGVSWCLAYVILAKGDGKIYLVTESVSSALYIVFNIVGYELMGLTGCGIAYAIWYFAYFVSVGIVFYRRYHLRLSPAVLTATAITAILTIGCCVARYLDMRWVVILIAAASTAICLHLFRRILFRR